LKLVHKLVEMLAQLYFNVQRLLPVTLRFNCQSYIL